MAIGRRGAIAIRRCFLRRRSLHFRNNVRRQPGGRWQKRLTKKWVGPSLGHGVDLVSVARATARPVSSEGGMTQPLWSRISPKSCRFERQSPLERLSPNDRSWLQDQAAGALAQPGHAAGTSALPPSAGAGRHRLWISAGKWRSHGSSAPLSTLRIETARVFEQPLSPVPSASNPAPAAGLRQSAQRSFSRPQSHDC